MTRIVDFNTIFIDFFPVLNESKIISLDSTSVIKCKYLFERFDIAFFLANFAEFSYMSNHEMVVMVGCI